MHQKFPFKLVAVLATSAAAILAFATLKSSQVTVAAQESETQRGASVLDATGKPKAHLPLKQRV